MNFCIKLKALLCALASTFVLSTSTQAATLLVDMGILTGATEVDVNGVLYDVEFIGGSCAIAADGCDELSDFTFAGDEATALAASAALRDQVILDGVFGNFDSFPDTVRGCGLPQSCAIRTPFDLSGGSVIASLFNNLAAGSMGVEVIVTSSSGSSGPFTASPGTTWAVFSETSVSEVPLPAPAFLLMFGLAGLGLVARRRCAV